MSVAKSYNKKTAKAKSEEMNMNTLNINGTIVTETEVLKIWEETGRNINKTYNALSIKNGQEKEKGFVKDVIRKVESAEYKEKYKDNNVSTTAYYAALKRVNGMKLTQKEVKAIREI